MDELGEEQGKVINAAFRRLRSKQQRSELHIKPSIVQFSAEDLENIRKEFLKACDKG